MNNKKIAFHTFGCKLNFSETSTISRQFSENAYKIVNFKEEADIYVIHSCTVTANAERKCRAAVHRVSRINPEATIVVMGCYAQLRAEEIAGMKEVDIILGNKEKYNLFEYLKNFKKTGKQEIHISNISKTNEFIPSYSYGNRTRSFLKIQDGCDYFCTYCTIPLARGHSRSNTIADTIKIANTIAGKGTKEIVLTGVNIGDFGKNNNETFFELIQHLDKIKGIERIRISSIEPDLLYDEIIEFVSNSTKLLPHFHIPLQSGSNKILKAMRRKYNRELFAHKIRKIKSLMPYSCIAADVIVGFPGETDNDFTETYNFIKELDISYLHVFTYSDRPNTQAAKIIEKIPGNIKKNRSKQLHKLSNEKKKYFYEQNIGKKYKVLFESDSINGYMHGFTENYIKVKTKYNPDLINQIVKIKLKKIDEQGVFIIDDL